MTDQLNIIFDNFGICLLGYRNEFSFLYIPQGRYFISTLRISSADQYLFFQFEEKSTFNICDAIFSFLQYTVLRSTSRYYASTFLFVRSLSGEWCDI